MPPLGLAVPDSEAEGPADRAVSTSTGQAQMEIPIDVPQGTGGFEPSLTLRYASNRSDGIFGVGWGLSLGEIRRSSRFGTPSFNDATDRFEMDGQLLVPNPGGTEFRTATETFARLKPMTVAGAIDRWEVSFPNGSKARFGYDPTTQIRQVPSTTAPYGTGPIARWLLSELEDENGNTIRFVYDRTTDLGTAYPTRVEYTYFNGSLVGGVLRSVDLVYESRQGLLTRVEAGVYSMITQRVREIKSLVAGNPYRRRTFRYNEPTASGLIYSTDRDRLTSTTLYGTDCTAADPDQACSGMPAQEFDYSDPEEELGASGPQWSSNAGWTIPEEIVFDFDGDRGVDRGVRFGDVNGDGLVDLLRAVEWPSSETPRKVYLNTGSGFVEDTVWSDHLDAIQFQSWKFITGYGFAPCNMIPYTAKVTFTQIPPGVGRSRWDGAQDPIDASQGAQLVDLNRDGLVDIFVSFEAGPVVCVDQAVREFKPAQKVVLAWINQGEGAGWQLDPQLSDPSLPPLVTTGFEQCTINPMIPVWASGCSVQGGPMYSTGGHFFITGLSTAEALAVWSYPLGMRFADINGDRRPDLVAATTHDFLTHSTDTYAHVNATAIDGAWLNTEQGWVPASNEYTPPQAVVSRAAESLSDTGVRFADLNSDGLADMVKTAVPIENIEDADPAVFAASGVWLNTGSGWCDLTGCPEGGRYAPPKSFAREALGINSQTGYVIWGNALHLMDANGDGFPDLVGADASAFPGGLKTWLYDPGAPGGSVWVEDPRFQPPLATLHKTTDPGVNIQYDTGTRLLDVDGNGTVDFLRSAPSHLGGKDTRLSLSTIPDRLREHRNGRGATSRYEYENFPIHAPTITPDASQLAETFDPDAVILLPNPGPVVSSVTVFRTALASAVGHLTTFQYLFPRWSTEHASYLGFQAVHSETPGPATTSYFYQSPGVSGQTKHRNTSGLLLETFTRELLDGSVVNGSVGGANVGRLIATARQTLDGTGSPGTLITTTQEYDDAYGFNFAWRTTIARPTSTATVERVPEPVDATEWIAGLVAQETVKHGGIIYRDTLYNYNARGQVNAITRVVQERTSGASVDPGDDAVTVLTRDNYGNVIDVQDPEGRTWRYCFDGTPSPCPSTAGTNTRSVLAGFVDRLGEFTEIASDLGSGEATYIKRFNDDQIWLARDPVDRIESVHVQPASHGSPTLLEERFYEDDVLGAAGLPNLVRVEQVGDGSTVRTATYVDGFGSPVRRVYEVPDGYAGTYVDRDFLGRPTRESFSLPCGSDPHCLTLASSPGPAADTTYDVLGRILSRTSPDDSHEVSYRSASVTQPAGSGVSPTPIDAALVASNGVLTRYSLDGSRIVWTDECANVPLQPIGSETCIAPDSTFQAYEPTGEVAAIYDASGLYSDPSHRLVYTYDTLGRILGVADPDGGLTQTTYDRVGNVKTVTNARSQTTAYFYDALDRVEGINYPDPEKDVAITYDPATRDRQEVNHENRYILTYAYDAFGRERRRVLDAAFIVGATDFEYDLLGRTTRIQYPAVNADVSYAYEGGYLKAVCGLPHPADCEADPSAYIWRDVAYDDIGRVATIEEGDVGFAQKSFEYDPATYRVTDITYTSQAGSTEILDLHYQYELGRVKDIVDERANPGALDASASYTYDARGRLESAAILGTSTPSYFGYDRLGNLTHRSVTAPATTGNQNQFFGSAGPHQVSDSQFASKTYDYDADGNLTRRGAQYLSYDSQNRLKCTGASAGSCAETQVLRTVDGEPYLTIDPLGQRYFFGDLFVYDYRDNTATVNVFALGQLVAVELSDDASMREVWTFPSWLPDDPRPLLLALAILLGAAALYWLLHQGFYIQLAQAPIRSAVSLSLVAALLPHPAWAGGPPGGDSTWVTRWIGHDHLGNAVAFVDSAGQVVNRRVFEPFGMIAGESGSETRQRRFTGQRFEEENQLYDFRARWYDAEVGRFVSIDPLLQAISDPQTHNPYSYVGNDPVNRIDPTGEFIGTLIVIAALLFTETVSISAAIIVGVTGNMIGDALIDTVVAGSSTTAQDQAAADQQRVDDLIANGELPPTNAVDDALARSTEISEALKTDARLRDAIAELSDEIRKLEDLQQDDQELIDRLNRDILLTEIGDAVTQGMAQLTAELGGEMARQDGFPGYEIPSPSGRGADGFAERAIQENLGAISRAEARIVRRNSLIRALKAIRRDLEDRLVTNFQRLR